MTVIEIIGERSETPSDKLGGEIFISSRALVCLSLYIYGVVQPDNQYHAHSHCVHTLTLKGWFLPTSSRPEIIIFPMRGLNRIEFYSMPHSQVFSILASCIVLTHF